MQSFLDLGLPETLARGLSSLGFSAPTPVQARVIPDLLAGKDILMESETGTGKTFAFLAPILAMVSAEEAGPRAGRDGPLALVAAPTQELAVQIAREAERLAKASGIELPLTTILGGSPMVKQEAKLKEKPVLVVGTLGRLSDLAKLRTLKMRELRILVLDEADRNLAPETEELALNLLSMAPRTATRVLASATLPERTLRIASPFLRDPLLARIESEEVLSGDIEHWCFYCESRKRMDFIRRFDAALEPKRVLLFLSNAARVGPTVERLADKGLSVEGIHARLDKEDRRHALERFSRGEVRYLLTSDLGARGLDIPGIEYVISLDLPEEPTVYIHRAGRTGRAGAKGVSVILADGYELKRASRIAMRKGFVFRTKSLEAGAVYEPSPEDFFADVERAEAERSEYRKTREDRPEGPARPTGKPFDRPYERSYKGPAARPARPDRDHEERPPRPGHGPVRRDERPFGRPAGGLPERPPHGDAALGGAPPARPAGKPYDRPRRDDRPFGRQPRTGGTSDRPPRAGGPADRPRGDGAPHGRSPNAPGDRPDGGAAGRGPRSGQDRAPRHEDAGRRDGRPFSRPAREESGRPPRAPFGSRRGDDRPSDRPRREGAPHGESPGTSGRSPSGRAPRGDNPRRGPANGGAPKKPRP